MTLPAHYKEELIGLLMETGNVSAACRALGLQRMTVYSWRHSDPDLARRWDLALEVARQGLRERVIETAEAMGVGRWVPALHPLTGEPVLDDEFEPLMRFETSNVDARVLMKLMDKTMRDEVRRVDQRTLVAGRIEHGDGPRPPDLVLVDADGTESPLLPVDDEEEEDEA